MKKFIIALVAICVSASAFAQKDAHKNDDFRERMQSIKIGYLTTEIGLSPEEAQVFWPIFNQAETEMRDAQKAVYKAQKAMENALKEKEGKADYKALVNDYVKAVAARDAVQGKYVSKYEKVLPAEKVAKYLLAEEKFRRDQIRQLQGMGHNHWGQQSGAPQGKQFQGRQPQQGRPQQPQSQPSPAK